MRKPLIILVLTLFVNCAFGQIWQEVFDEAASATSGTGSPSGAWTSTCVGCNARDGFGNLFEVSTTGAGFFSAGKTNGGMGAEGVWTSPVISIVGFTDIKVYIETGALFTEVGDYLRVYYRLNTGAGLGPETLFHTATNGSVTSVGTSPALNGTQVQFVVRAFTDAAVDFFTFDNISVTNTLFSRASAVWATAGTWSAVAVNGVSCACTPTQYTSVVVGGGNTVTIGANAAAAGLQVNGTADAGGAGIVTYSGNFNLDISLGGALATNTGGQITSGGNASSALTFTDNQSHTVTNAGSLSVGDITITNSSLFTPTVITVSGAGGFAITDALTLSESSIQSVTLTSGVIMTTGGAITLSNSSTLNNNGTITMSGATTLNNTSTITNNGTISMSAATTLNNTSSVTNNGTVTMTSTAAAVLSGAGTWTQGVNSTLNYAGSTLTITTLTATNTGNTVDYNRGGAQNIATTTYYNLTLSNSRFSEDYGF